MMSSKYAIRGLQGYARALQAVGRGITPSELCTRLGCNRITGHSLLWRFEAMGLVHVTAWLPPDKPKSCIRPLFAMGEGDSVPRPARTKERRKAKTHRPTAELVAFAHVVKALEDGATLTEMHETSGIAKSNLALLLRLMRKLKLAHIGAYLSGESGGNPTAVFHLGEGADAKKPRAMTRPEIQKAYRSRRKARRTGVAMTQVIAGKQTAPLRFAAGLRALATPVSVFDWRP